MSSPTSKELVENTYPLDEKIVDYNDGSKEKDPAITAVESGFLRKIDMMILPIICAINFLQYLDKTTINYAALLHFKEDLHLDGNQFNFAGSVFYIGYLVFQLPNNYLLQRIAIGRYIGVVVFVWGMVLVCTGLVQNFSQLSALRFLLGFFEGGIYPALTLLISTFYRKKEQAARLGYVWLCNGLAGVFGGLIAYGIGRMNDHGIARWRWLMFIFGAVTCFIGLVAFFFLIGDPKSRFLRLTPEQEALVDERTRDNLVYRTKTIKREQQIEALKEVRLWAFFAASFFFSLRNGGMTIYGAQITKSFGFSGLQAILLTIPIGALDVIVILLAVYIANKTKQTLYVASGSMVIGTIGTVLMIVIPNPKLKLIGQYLGLSAVPTYILMLASISNNVSGYSKKIFCNSMMIVFYTVGNAVGPFIMAPQFAPTYVKGFAIYICTSMLGVACLLIARWQMVVANRRKAAQPSNTVTNVEDDLTDIQNPNFVYRL
ncbi:hypothetical protein EC973_007560 [Apophysomyces ossiformis]|uniref:Major facilitator superfamily (MFS) profile domain-containing protein n=1 Tax=Apophysomyces ossiformis TaxID=679940 RepID=A0A8H7BRP7_9FUNG|nr:hypothetical protein EC973_007560 [Apophysomyces ossiformis]